MIGVGRLSLGIKEDMSDKIRDFKIEITSADKEWELSSLTVQLKAYTDSSALFSSPSLQQNKPKLRHQLLDITQFPNLLGKLLEMGQDSNSGDDRRVASLQCILKFLRNNRSNQKAYSEFLRLFTEKTDI